MEAKSAKSHVTMTLFYLIAFGGLTARQYYFTNFEPSQS